ncbi:MAG TPA: WXG100 family type VII secretion target [Ktedonobacteraceae bacterium]|jgi:early secretory antigenic target protein ESAT-6|nr:WXG100 family type VII secretion target [Ktedonobacteraceae bacterium]
MSGRIMVTPEELQQASSQFNAKAAELEQMLQSVQSQIESLRSTWQGQAAANFDALMAQWTQDVQGINQVLSQVSQHLNQASQAYSETDTSIARGFQA